MQHDPTWRLSVIVPTKNRPDDLLETAEAILAQTRLPDELIVVDQSATDESGRRLKQMLGRGPAPRLIYIWDRSITGLPMARNAGFTASSGDLICYLDDDITPAPGYLDEIERGFEFLPQWDGLCGRLTENERATTARRLGRRLFRLGLFRDGRERLAKLDFPEPLRLVCGGASCFRRKVLERFRFDENLTGYALGEDVDFCLRSGRKFRFGAYPAARWHHRRSMVGRAEPAEMRKMARASAAYLRRVHRRHLGDDLAYFWLLIGFRLDELVTWCCRLRACVTKVGPIEDTSERFWASRGVLGANRKL